MKKLFYIVVIMLFLVSCRNILYPKYKLATKIRHPLNTPDLVLEFTSDTTGTVLKKNDTTVKQTFSFYKAEKHVLIITSTDTNSLGIIKKGYTLIYYKRWIYVFDKRLKLAFVKK